MLSQLFVPVAHPLLPTSNVIFLAHYCSYFKTQLRRPFSKKFSLTMYRLLIAHCAYLWHCAYSTNLIFLLVSIQQHTNKNKHIFHAAWPLNGSQILHLVLNWRIWSVFLLGVCDHTVWGVYWVIAVCCIELLGSICKKQNSLYIF